MSKNIVAQNTMNDCDETPQNTTEVVIELVWIFLAFGLSLLI